MSNRGDSDTHPHIGLLALYFVGFIGSGLYFQLTDDTPPWVDGAPIEYFTGGLLWMSSLIGLLMADTLRPISRRWLLWMGVTAGLALLAVDERFALHEKTKQTLGDDDHIKVVALAVTAVALYLINRFEASSRATRTAFLTAFVVHSIYVFGDIGDGDYFMIPGMTKRGLQQGEEWLELTALTSYFIGFLFLYTNTRRAALTANR